MRPAIHPATRAVVFRDKSAGTAFLTRSTIVTRDLPTVEWEDGRTYRCGTSTSPPPATRSGPGPPASWTPRAAWRSSAAATPAPERRKHASRPSEGLHGRETCFPSRRGCPPTAPAAGWGRARTRRRGRPRHAHLRARHGARRRQPRGRRRGGRRGPRTERGGEVDAAVAAGGPAPSRPRHVRVAGGDPANPAACADRRHPAGHGTAPDPHGPRGRDFVAGHHRDPVPRPELLDGSG